MSWWTIIHVTKVIFIPKFLILANINNYNPLPLAQRYDKWYFKQIFFSEVKQSSFTVQVHFKIVSKFKLSTQYLDNTEPFIRRMLVRIISNWVKIQSNCVKIVSKFQSLELTS